MRHQPRSRLQPPDFDKINVSPNSGKLKNLIEALVQPRGLNIVEDERHVQQPKFDLSEAGVQ